MCGTRISEATVIDDNTHESVLRQQALQEQKDLDIERERNRRKLRRVLLRSTILVSSGLVLIVVAVMLIVAIGDAGKIVLGFCLFAVAVSMIAAGLGGLGPSRMPRYRWGFNG